ncbi:cytochrome ubiquinol oxidase subunit I [Caldivirga sp. UBA161]|uniref:cytochrome ubiquinol oxidase subunit I n=1 Tax=Caldivirga sp. UBA161 TaxID=1915569 RepID=UPI0025BC9CA7|nr:cytochrome ubiquinol oxidase subunit I [Caldivirga sp. UBA161]
MVSPVVVAVALIAWAFSVHLPLVYTVLGLGWLLPTLELIGYRSGKRVYIDIAHGLSNYLIAVYAIGGVFGTIVTVFLAGLLPVFTNIAGALLWPVWGIAIVFGVAIALPFIGFYYRSFNRLSPMKHIAVGYAMAITLTVIPAMFRLVFAFINYPAGVAITPSSTSNTGFTLSVNLTKALGNPTYPPLLSSTLLGAIAMTSILISSIHGWRYTSSRSEYHELGHRIGNTMGLIFGILYSIFAAWYLYTIYQYSPTVAWSIFGHPPSYLQSAFYELYRPTFNLSWMLYMNIALGAIILVLLVISIKITSKPIEALKLVLTPMLMDSAEVMNGLAHAPYAIVPPVTAAEALIKAYGLSFALNVAKWLTISQLLTPQINALLSLVSIQPGLLVGSLIFFAFFNALLLYVIYAALSWRRSSA